MPRDSSGSYAGTVSSDVGRLRGDEAKEGDTVTIKAHCMGTEFPKRDTDSQNVEWVSQVPYFHSCPMCGGPHATSREASLCWAGLPSEADLDRVAEEQRVKEKTGG